MSLASLFAQLLNGLAGASALFLVAAGLTLIFGVTRVVNFAHGSLYMLGAYIAYSLVATLPRGPVGFWAAVILGALAVARLKLAGENVWAGTGLSGSTLPGDALLGAFAGVACVGVGSNLITKEILAAKDWDGLANKVAETLAIVQRVRGKQP